MVVACARAGAAAGSVLCGARRRLTASAKLAASNRTTEVETGPGCVEKFAKKHTSLLGARALVVCGNGPSAEAGHFQRVSTILRSAGVECSHWSMQDKYPMPAAVDAAVAMARRIGAQSIVAVGGGAVIDAGKAIGAVAGQRGLCRSYMRVNYKEEEMKGKHLPVVAIPTSHAAGAALSPECLLLYEPEEALAPLNTHSVAPRVTVVDPQLCRTLPPEAQGTMSLATLSVCVDALLGHAVPPQAKKWAREGAQAIARGLAEPDKDKRLEALCAGSVCAGQVLAAWGPRAAAPIQNVTRLMAPLFPKASYSAIATSLMHAYLQAVQDGVVVVNEGLLGELCGDMVGRQGGGTSAMAVEWVGKARAAHNAMLVLTSEGREERMAAAVAEQVSNVLTLFEIDRESSALDLDVLHHILAKIILDKK